MSIMEEKDNKPSRRVIAELARGEKVKRRGEVPRRVCDAYRVRSTKQVYGRERTIGGSRGSILIYSQVGQGARGDARASLFLQTKKVPSA